jgi:GNAT superfamily N-acetyltransferase
MSQYKKVIKDRHGRVLNFTQERTDELVYFKLEFHKACAAYVNCQIEGEVLVVADLFVEENCVVPHPDFVMRLFGRKTLEVNFRKQGIGSQLLTTVVAYAKSKGLKRIEGSLAGRDLDPGRRLARWFQKRGFSMQDAVVFMDLSRTPKDDSRFMPKR